MSIQWSEKQQAVIDARGCSVLVSAAAGSGKTAVLVERLIRLLTDEKYPVDIERLLVVTFTNAAAAKCVNVLAEGWIRNCLKNRITQHGSGRSFYCPVPRFQLFTVSA